MSRKGLISLGSSDSKEGPPKHTHTHPHTQSACVSLLATKEVTSGLRLEGGAFQKKRDSYGGRSVRVRGGPGTNESLCASLHPSALQDPHSPIQLSSNEGDTQVFLDCLNSFT